MKRSVMRNVAYGLKIRGITADVTTRVYEALALVGLPGERYARRPWYALSGGEAQRVALAARLVLKPQVLVLDEPTASVDAASAQLIKEASWKAREKLGTTLIIASHDWQWINEICDQVLHMHKGRIFGTGRENIIFGPWTQSEEGHWGKILADGQYLRVATPPDEASAAVIDALTVSKAATPSDPADWVVKGTVVRVNLAGNNGGLFATVMAGGQAFTVRLTLQPGEESRAYPGQTVFIHYHPDQVQWL
jgi:tungstate transport system ATP-binding protein